MSMSFTNAALEFTAPCIHSRPGGEVVRAARRASPACGAITASVPKRARPSLPLYGWFTEGFDTRDLVEMNGQSSRRA